MPVRITTALVAALLVLARNAAAQGALPGHTVQVEETDRAIHVANTAIRLDIDKASGRVTSFQFGERELLCPRGGAYLQFYAKAGSADGREPMPRSDAAGPSVVTRVIRREADLVEVGTSRRMSGFEVDMRYVVRAGEPGFYNYIIVRTAPESASADRVLEQVNFCLRANPDLFRYATLGEEKQGLLPRPQDLREGELIMDATYRLQDGTIDAKYDWTLEETGGRVFGLMGDTLGLFLVKDSGEALNSGPVARELSVHQTTTSPVLLRHLVAGHYGRGSIRFKPSDPPWAKLAGPWFLYVAEGTSRSDLWAKAEARAAQAVREWPYQWMRDPLYPLERGSVTGRLALSNGASLDGSLVFLGPAPTPLEPDWQQSGKGYFFWTRARADGSFDVGKVREGRYTLWALNDAQFGEFRQDNVEVTAGKTTRLGTLLWQPDVRGQILWTLGTPDRTAKEFRHGDDYRHWGLWQRYPTDFPNDVDFKIGRSRERTDWNYLQPAVPNPDGTWRMPEWKIRFDVPHPTNGQAWLRIGVAGVSSQGGAGPRGERQAGFEVRLNGERLQTCLFPNDSGSTRSGIRGRYHEALIGFDAARLTPGENTISLTLTPPAPRGGARNYPWSAVLYDALRLELEPR